MNKPPRSERKSQKIEPAGAATPESAGSGMSHEGDAFEAIIELARSVAALQEQAAKQYKPVVDDILRTGSRDPQHIERTLDGLLDFCGHEPVLAMYRQISRHYWFIDPAATAHYVNAYRELWDSDEDQGPP